jgi:2-amino-4-hydroxy-6-hydroxymethyldihydropteridine diphosphokinase
VPPRRPGARPRPSASRRPHAPSSDAPSPPGAERAVEERRRPREPVRAFLALGSNLGDRRQYLQDAVRRLPDVVAVSHVYETDPMGGPPGQGAYLNCVVELRTSRSPRELLGAAQAAEAAAERVRVERWGPRTLDVDVLLVGDEKVDEPDLVVPHPRMWERGFVLVPLADLAPELVVGHLTSDIGRGVRPAGNL